MSRRFLAAVVISILAFSSAFSRPIKDNPQVDIVFCLDLSGSTNGLVEELKANFWDIVQEFNKYSPRPSLRIGIIGAGRVSYKKENDYVAVLCPLTENLDKAAGTIYSLEARIQSGKPNNIGSALRDAIKINWSTDENTLKLVYVIGNGKIGHARGNAFEECAKALEVGITINTIFCINEKNGGELAEWRDLSKAGGGHFFAFNPAAPIVFLNPGQSFKEIYKLNSKLNSTYLDINPDQSSRKNFVFLDSAAIRIHPMLFISRVAFKSSEFYQGMNSKWDLVESMVKQEPEEFTFGFKSSEKKEKETDARMEQALRLKKERQETTFSLRKLTSAFYKKPKKADGRSAVANIKEALSLSLDQHLQENSYERLR